MNERGNKEHVKRNRNFTIFKIAKNFVSFQFKLSQDMTQQPMEYFIKSIIMIWTASNYSMILHFPVKAANGCHSPKLIGFDDFVLFQSFLFCCNWNSGTGSVNQFSTDYQLINQNNIQSIVNYLLIYRLSIVF